MVWSSFRRVLGRADTASKIMRLLTLVIITEDGARVLRARTGVLASGSAGAVGVCQAFPPPGSIYTYLSGRRHLVLDGWRGATVTATASGSGVAAPAGETPAWAALRGLVWLGVQVRSQTAKRT